MYKNPNIQEIKKDHSDQSLHDLLEFWDRLSAIKTVVFSVYSRAYKKSGWEGIGSGTINVSMSCPNILVFQEVGTWSGMSQKKSNYTNSLRWTFEKDLRRISLEHLRFGLQSPVFLCHWAMSTSKRMHCANPHFCKKDVYFGELLFETLFIKLVWKVKGPKKNEEIHYCYYS